MKMRAVTTSLFVTSFAISSVALACSNIFISGPHNIAAVARTMDLEMNTGNKFAFGAKDTKNTANIDVPQKQPINAMKWTTQFPFVGQSMLSSYVITDGINNQGLYAAWLDLPDFSVYPSYDPNNKRPEIGITDLTNFVLGTSKNVIEAIANIKKTQPVMDALAVKLHRRTVFGGSAIHLVLRDREGNAAVIEWTSYQKKSAMHVYLHKGGTDTVVETIPGTGATPITFNNAKGAAVTNAPDYAWQLKNTAKYNYVFTGSTNKQWDGAFMNGSGMFGIPGDWTPPSRFIRATQLARVMPIPKTETQATALAYEVLQTIKTQVGTNPAASLWATVSDLHNNIYYFKPLLSVAPNFTTNHFAISLPKFNTPWQQYNVTQLGMKNKIPNGWVSAAVKQGPIATVAEVKKLNKMVYAPTPGNEKATITWMK